MTAAAVLKACLAIIFREIWSRRSTVHISLFHANHKKSYQNDMVFPACQMTIFIWLIDLRFLFFSILQSIDVMVNRFTLKSRSILIYFKTWLCSIFHWNFWMTLKILMSFYNFDEFSRFLRFISFFLFKFTFVIFLFLYWSWVWNSRA